jgi:hypothetical protein
MVSRHRDLRGVVRRRAGRACRGNSRFTTPIARPGIQPRIPGRVHQPARAREQHRYRDTSRPGRVSPRWNPYTSAKTKPARFTLDLEQAQHQFLKTYAAQTGPDVGAAQVLRALLEELQADPDLAARVRARIWQRKG